jgi:hypothetical protein
MQDGSTAKLALHHCRQDGGDPAPGIAAILAATVQSEFCGTAQDARCITRFLHPASCLLHLH